MFAADYLEMDQQTGRGINHVRLPELWEMAAKQTGIPEIISLAGIIHSKLHQAGNNLEIILQQEQKMTESGECSKQVGKIGAFVMKSEMESLLLTLNQIMDLSAGMIALVYGIKTNMADIDLKDFFPLLINSKPFFNELQRKDPILAEELASFYFSDEYRLLMKLLYQNGLHCFTKGTPLAKITIQPGLDPQTIGRIEKAYCKIVCILSQIMFSHSNYEPVLIQYFSGYQPAC